MQKRAELENNSPVNNLMWRDDRSQDSDAPVYELGEDAPSGILSSESDAHTDEQNATERSPQEEVQLEQVDHDETDVDGQNQVEEEEKVVDGDQRPQVEEDKSNSDSGLFNRGKNVIQVSSICFLRDSQDSVVSENAAKSFQALDLANL